MEPRRGVLAPSVERWLAQPQLDGRQESTAERRTLVVRLPASADPQQAADRLRDAGATVQTAGAASVTVAVTREALQQVLTEPWVLAVEEPRRLFPSIGSGPDLPGL